MGILRAAFQGIGLSVRKGKVVVFLYLVNLLFALAVAAPAMHLLARELGHSTAGASLEHGFDLRTALDLRQAGRGAWGAWLGFLAHFGVLYVMVSTFLSGGAITCLHHRNERVSLAFFFLGCGRHLFRFLRLLLLAGLGLVMLAGANALADRILSGMLARAFGESVAQVVGWTKTGILALALLVFLMVLDFARIRIVVEGRRSAFAAFFASLRFCARFPLKTTGVTFLFLGLGWGLLGLGEYLSNAGAPSPGTWTLVGLEQGSVLLRLGVGFAGLGARLALFKGLGVATVSPPAGPVEGPAVHLEEPPAPERIPLSQGPPQPPDVPAPAEG